VDAGPHQRRLFLGAAVAGLGLAGLSGSGSGHRTAGPSSESAPTRFDVRAFGAQGDGATRDTAAIQAAIDAASASGGGTVVLPSGQFLSGTITLKSRVTLHLTPGAVLLGSTDVADYPARAFPARDLDVGGYRVWSLVFAEDAEQIAIEGDGGAPRRDRGAGVRLPGAHDVRGPARVRPVGAPRRARHGA
jgi:polygalacturonase